MVLTFLLLGAFEIETGPSQRIAVGDSMAARLLAYLAFHGRFCSRIEIIKGCWGAHKLAGRDKLEDEAYSRQVSNLRLIFTRTLGRRWEDYLLTQPNGMQLKDDTYKTDIARFHELLAAGRDEQYPAAQRLAALRDAEGLRRGYLLDGMHCEWIVSETGGARSAWESDCAGLRLAVTDLLRPAAASAGSPATMVANYDGFDVWFAMLRELIAVASEEVILYGINFHIMIPMLRPLLLDRLRAGARIKILMLDPHGRWLEEMAIATGNDPVTLKAEGVASLSGLAEIRKKWQAETADKDSLAADHADSRFEVRLFDSMIHGRMYAFDADRDTGKLFLFPYVYGISPSLLSGYLWNYSAQGPYQTYLHELRRLWDSAASMVPSPITSDMSEAPVRVKDRKDEVNP